MPERAKATQTGGVFRMACAIDATIQASKVPFAKERVFKPRVSKVEPGRSMIWSPNGHGTTGFSMKEEFLGLMLPMIGGSLPDVAPVFEAYAEDLKRAAEGPTS